MKREIISKTIKDLPVKSIRCEMTDEEWYVFFEEVYDQAFSRGSLKGYNEGYNDRSDELN